ncbi:ABC transporter substrate-binding protein [Halobacterium bonnevillei]|uniref:ABC transporter substrate-binding protein n=1 Tax=Halobacterium bonnevillei TaxID=2692200 RepID=A0A6B0SE80_9EURY|nr:ABC transporter substrate-binding protein [Halobacterium bonnevillei]MXR19247.1 ABC transporter substrate-binding protein [Halobacterium bonnevillei]
MRRRRFIKAGSAAALAGLFAGCASPNEGGDATTEAPTETTAAADTTTTAAETSDDETTTETGSYSVSMTPTGEVEFDSVPQDIAVYMPGYADMLVALGHSDAIASVGQKGRFHSHVYDELDGVDADESEMVDLIEQGISRETLLNLDPDLFLVDPNWLTNVFELSSEDVEFLEERAAPFLGNTIFRRTDAWHDYDYYTLYEAFEKVSQVVQEQERYEAFKSYHDDVVDRIAADVPSEGPRGALVWGGSNQPTEFSPYHLSGEGANKKSFHDLNVRDAIANSDVEALSESQRSKIDYETLLELDPEVLFVRGHEAKTPEEFETTVLSFMQDHDTASRITAVENGDVYRGGPIFMGPIQHLFLTERFATELYPESFSGDLFDRGELASIITS